MKVILFTLFIFIGSSNKLFALDLQIRPYLSAIYSLSDFENTDTTAKLSGFGHQAGIELKAKARDYTVSLIFGSISKDLVNSANTGVRSENISHMNYRVGGRFYSLNAFVGLSGLIYSSKLTETVGIISTTSKLSGFGLLAEVGIDLFWGKNFYYTPSLQYIKSRLEDKITDNKVKTTEIDVVLSLGWQF